MKHLRIADDAWDLIEAVVTAAAKHPALSAPQRQRLLLPLSAVEPIPAPKAKGRVATASAPQETTSSMPLDQPQTLGVHSLSVNELADVFDKLVYRYLDGVPVVVETVSRAIASIMPLLQPVLTTDQPSARPNVIKTNRPRRAGR